MQSVLKKIKPDQKEVKRVQKVVQTFLKKITPHLGKGIPILGGSYAKGTWLKNNHDIDVFVAYPDNDQLSERLFSSLKKSFKKVEQIHGSRDYFHVSFQGLAFELVPVHKITKPEEALNVTDVSLLHVVWVLEHLDSRLADDVRLLKQFCTAQGVYGAETYQKGFAGYVLEILTIYYGSFFNVLKHSLTWKEGMTIDVTAKGNITDPNKLSALNVVDPVQPSRNAAAALSAEKMRKFQDAARGYLHELVKETTASFFVPQKISLVTLKKTNSLVLLATPKVGKEDVIGTKLLKAHEFLITHLNTEGYVVKKQYWVWEGKKVYFCYQLKLTKLPLTFEHQGPPLQKEADVVKFKMKHTGKKFFQKDGRIFVQLKRTYPTLKQFLQALFKDTYLKERVKTIKIISLKR